MNTSIHYRYSDASNYTVGRTVIVEGAASDEQVKAIYAALDGGEFFIPSQVGLDNLQPELQVYDVTAPSEDDHAWHMIERGNIEHTEDKPTVGMSIGELTEAFAAVEWDESDPALPFDL